jgi:F-type H+-transporting ATPase subunit delta
MKEKVLVKRYGQALALVAKETIGLEQIISESKALKWIMLENPEFQEFLTNPEIIHLEKEMFIEKVLDDEFSKLFRNMILLLVEKRRIQLLPDILDYLRLTYGHGEAIDAVLQSAYPLDLDQIRQIKVKLETKFHRKVNIYFELEPDLLGGVKVICGNKVFDGSLQQRLKQLKDKLYFFRAG